MTVIPERIPLQQADAELIAAMNRIAQAIEQLTLTYFDRTMPAHELEALPTGDPPWPGNAIASLLGAPFVPAAPQAVVAPAYPNGPPVALPPPPAGTCPQHGVPWTKWVPPGVSKTGANAGKAYNGFWACPAANCRERPPR